MEQHGRTVVYGVLGVGVLAFGMAVVNEMGKRSEAAASSSFGASLRVLDREVDGPRRPSPVKSLPSRLRRRKTPS